MKAYPYPSISQFERGSFGWAMDQCRAGNDVRRSHWPIEARADWTGSGHKPYIAVWHVYVCNAEAGSMCCGFSSGSCGGDNDEYVGLGVDSMGYYATTEDKTALDWQTVDQVTQGQIVLLDANRWPHFPSYYTPERLHDEQRGGNLTVVLVLMAIAAFVVMLILRR